MMQNNKAVIFSLALVSFTVAFGPCVANAADAVPLVRKVVELPLFPGWYEGREVQYVSTDASDASAAAEMGANYVPRLANALVPPTPGKPTSVERIYKFTNFAQGSVLPSVPEPVGSANRNRNYSPLWQVYMVAWKAGVKPRELRAEEEVLDAEEKGELTITKSNIVVNCPVVFFEGAGLLPGASIKTVPEAVR